MYILGLNYNNKDAAACLLKDGKLVAAAEERFLWQQISNNEI